jgi:hypothetical protein
MACLEPAVASGVSHRPDAALTRVDELVRFLDPLVGVETTVGVPEDTEFSADHGDAGSVVPRREAGLLGCSVDVSSVVDLVRDVGDHARQDDLGVLQTHDKRVAMPPE